MTEPKSLYRSKLTTPADAVGRIASGATLSMGMAMTERQGGSDVRANITRAEPEGASGGGNPYRLTGHKWFCSAPMCDAFLVLAQAPGGLSCFFLPRVLPDGSRNGMHIARLKDKLGNRSNASSEIEIEDALAFLVGEEGRGVRTIVEMVNCTRLDCIIGSAALRHRSLEIWLIYPCVVFVLQGAAWIVAGVVRRHAWPGLLGAAWIVMGIAMGFCVEWMPIYALIAGAALIGLMAIPGAAMMRLVRRAA